MEKLNLEFSISPEHSKGLKLLDENLERETKDVTRRMRTFMDRYADGGVPVNWSSLSDAQIVEAIPDTIVAIMQDAGPCDSTSDMVSDHGEILDTSMRISYILVMRQKAELVVTKAALEEVGVEIKQILAREFISASASARLSDLQIAHPLLEIRAKELEEEGDRNESLLSSATALKKLADSFSSIFK